VRRMPTIATKRTDWDSTTLILAETSCARRGPARMRLGVARGHGNTRPGPQREQPRGTYAHYRYGEPDLEPRARRLT
jgi:hypothetical protein